MRRWLLAAVVLLIACGDSKKSEPKQEPPAEPAAAAPADAAPAAQKPPPSSPDAGPAIEIPELIE